MTDLSRILPDFPVARYAGLLPQLEKHQVTTADLLSLDVFDLGKRTKLPLLDLRRFCNAVLEALHADLGVAARPPAPAGDGDDEKDDACPLRRTGADLAGRMATVSTLDEAMDRVLGGGVPVGHITEITGESGAGKTQLLLTLLLAVQLPPPHGLGRPALYISTEAPLSTQRLSQLLRHHPRLRGVADADKPTLDGIVSCVTPDLESQDHILQFQVPVEVARRRVGLVVLDSVAANYRAEYERDGGSSLAARSADLIRLGQLLQGLARTHDLAVVVANQVADRFSSTAPALFTPDSRHRRPGAPPALAAAHDSPLASRSRGLDRPPPEAEPSSSLAHVRSSMPEPRPEEPPAPPALLLDHQQRWFTGWGDDPTARHGGSVDKTPSLGLVWSTQVACRLALLKRPVYGRALLAEDDDNGGGGAATLRRWRRWLKVVFAPHVPASGPGPRGAVEYEVVMGGLRAVPQDASKKRRKGDDSEGRDDP